MLINDLVYWPSALSSFLWYDRGVDASPSATITRWKSSLGTPGRVMTTKNELDAHYDAHHCIIFSLLAYGQLALVALGLVGVHLWVTDMQATIWHSSVVHMAVALAFYCCGLMTVQCWRAMRGYRALKTFNGMPEDEQSSFEYTVTSRPRNGDLLAAALLGACFIPILALV